MSIGLFTPSRSGSSERRTLAVLAVVVAAMTGLGSLGTAPARALIGALTLTVFTVVAFSSRRAALGAAIGWLILLGFTRRLLIPFAGWSTDDPLLLFSPAAAVVLLVATRSERPPPRSAISSIVVFHLLWVVVSVVNPNESNVVTAMQGALFFLMPLLWFFVGRRLTTDDHDRVLTLILWMMVPVIALGLWQTFVGLLPFELTWLHVANVSPAVVFVDGFHIRPFSTFASPQEYGLFLVLGITVLWVRTLDARHGRPRYVVGLGVAVLALFLQSSRGLFVVMLVVILFLTALHRRSIVGALFVVALVAALFSPLFDSGGVSTLERPAPDPDATNVFQPTPAEPASTVAALFRHELHGLLNPEDTTAGLHLELIREGFTAGLENPLGLGPSRFTVAPTSSAAADSSDVRPPENQLPLTMASLGIPAAIALLALYVTAFATALLLWRHHPSARHLAWVGFLVAAGDQALNGRLYATSTIVALVLGGIATEFVRLRHAQVTRSGLVRTVEPAVA